LAFLFSYIRAGPPMGRIQTNIGLITGIPIGDTVDALMKLAAKPRDMLVERTDTLRDEQIAVTELSTLLYMVRFITDNLGKEGVYDQRSATSSDPSTLSAVVTGKPPLGSYQYTPLRTVQTQQLLSSGFKSDTDPIGGGTFSFRFGDNVERNTPLELFGGGQGVARGRIRITDRSGASSEIDLSAVQTIDEVLDAINGDTTINVTALARGDCVRLIDNTGQAFSNLKVQEVGGGTAASLGLAGIDVARDVAEGRDVLWLYEGIDLEVLNDGSGVRIDTVLSDIEYELRDGTIGIINLSPIQSGGSDVDKERTLGEVLEAINAARHEDDPDKKLIRAEIAPDGDRLIITDLTEGTGEFKLTSLYASEVVEDLGLDGEAVDGVIVGRRILAGARTVLLSSLGGGKGLGQLGTLELTDRGGASDTVDLSAAETLQDVIDTINAAEVGVVARVNRARNGIELVDTTAMAASNLIVANADETATADKLAVAVDDNVLGTNSDDLHLQVVAQGTRLEDLNGGAGVARATLMITDSVGGRAVLDLTNKDIQTVDDVVRAINRLPLRVYADINDTGDGILIKDLDGGDGELQVLEGNSTTARDLNLFRLATTVDVDGEPTQVIDGSTTRTIVLGEDDSLEDLRQKINELDAGLSAMTFVDGSSKPFRLSLISDRAGRVGRLVVDASQMGFSLQETVRAQDALLVFGQADAVASSILVSSSSNSFRGVLPGLTLQIMQPSTSPVMVTVEMTDADLVANVQTMVDNYNKFRERLNELTAYDVETNTASLLSGDAAALRLDSELSFLLSGRFFGVGAIQSLGEIGVSLKSDGTLVFDESKLKARYAADPQAVQEFFSTEKLGVSAKFDKLIEQVAGTDVSLLANRFKTLRDRIAQNERRIEFLNDRLDNDRNQMLLSFYRMEIAIGKLQNNLYALDTIQPMTPVTTVRRGVLE